MERVAVADGVALTCEDVGSGPSALLVHGGCTSHRVWESTVRALAAAGHRVLAPDLRGHGASDAPDGPYTAARFGADLATLVDRRVGGPVAVVGWSLGATVRRRWPAITRGWSTGSRWSPATSRRSSPRRSRWPRPTAAANCRWSD